MKRWIGMGMILATPVAVFIGITMTQGWKLAVAMFVFAGVVIGYFTLAAWLIEERRDGED
jgi:hypothetical protein